MRLVWMAVTVGAPVRCAAYAREVGCGWAPAPTHVELVVARHDLLPGKTVERDDLAMTTLPVGAVDDRVFRSMDEVVGRVPIERVLPTEPMRPERFAPPEAGVGLSAVVDGAVRVDLPAGAAAIAAGDHVDLLVTTRTGGRVRTRTVLEGRRVVAVRADAERGVVLALSPDEADRTRRALDAGAPTLVLRSEADFPPGPTTGDGAPLADGVPLRSGSR